MATTAKRKPGKKTPARSTRTKSANMLAADGVTRLTTIAVTDMKYMGDEPTWAGQELWDISERKVKIMTALTWYNYSCDKKQAREFFDVWLKNQENGKALSAKFKRLPDSAFYLTVGWVCRMALVGLHLHREELDPVEAQIERLKARADAMTDVEESTEEVAVKKETIQDRLEEKLSSVIGDIEGAIDDYVINKKDFNAYGFLEGAGLAANFAPRVAEVFQARIKEFEEYLEGKDAQLLEGYGHLGKRGVKDLIKFYQSIVDSAFAYKSAKMAARAKPKRKPVPPERIVRKLNFLPQFEELKLESIDPRDILGASELWVYNTKTRKLGRYLAVTHGDMVISPLSVKNSNITGFDEQRSVAKTLRKPAEKLAEFRTQGKPGLRKFMDTIKSVETRLRPRISPETILLRAVK